MKGLAGATEREGESIPKRGSSIYTKAGSVVAPQILKNVVRRGWAGRQGVVRPYWGFC